MPALRCVPGLLSLALAAGVAAPALAQSQTPPPPPPAPTPVATTTVVARTDVRTGEPRRDTILKLMRPITVDFQEKRVEDVIAFVRDFSGAELEPLWIDDQNPVGLDKDKIISVKVENGTVLSLIDKVLEKARGDAGELAWQMTETGAMQIGPKERLNKYRRVEIYDVNDLLQEVPDHPDVPRIDLQQALQAAQGGGGGGGQSPFKEENQQTQQQRQADRQQKAEELTKILTELVEPEQWVDNGGDGPGPPRLRRTPTQQAPPRTHPAEHTA